MSQTAVNIDMGVSFAGMKASAGDDRVESFIAEEAIAFGRGVTAETGNITNVRLAGKDNADALYDADFVTGNVVAFSVNGTAIAPVTFAANHATTFAALIVAINDLANVTAVAGSGRHILIEVEDGTTALCTSTVTSGSTQAGVTFTYSADDVFRGVSVAQSMEQSVAGVCEYAAKSAVSVMRKGVIWVDAVKAVTADSAAYVDMAGAIGKFTDTSSGNLATGGVFRSTVGAAGLVKVEINLP